MKKIVCLLLALLLSLTVFAGCGSKQVEPNDTPTTNDETVSYTLVEPGKLTVAVSTDYAPFEFIDTTKEGQDKFVGADISYAKFLADQLGVELVIKSMDFNLLLAALDNHIADIAISGISYKADRAASYLYCDCYYSEGDGGQVVVVKASNLSNYQDFSTLNVEGKKVAAQNGALQQDLVAEQLPNATMVKIDDLNSAYDMLTTGSVDAVAVSENVAKTLVAAFPEKYAICPQPFEWEVAGNYALVEKSNTALAQAVNSAMENMTEGQYASWIQEADALFTNLGDKAVEDIVSEQE